MYRLDNGDDGEKRYCNTPLKRFRSSKGKEDAWSTSAALEHFKNKHEDSSSVLKQKAGAAKRQSHLGECMHASGSVGIHFLYFLKEGSDSDPSTERFLTRLWDVGGDGKGVDSDASSPLSYTHKYISLPDVGILCLGL